MKFLLKEKNGKFVNYLLSGKEWDNHFGNSLTNTVLSSENNKSKNKINKIILMYGTIYFKIVMFYI